MKKLAFIAIITSLAMTGCTQKEPEKKVGSSDKKVTAEKRSTRYMQYQCRRNPFYKVEKRRRECYRTS